MGDFDFQVPNVSFPALIGMPRKKAQAWWSSESRKNQAGYFLGVACLVLGKSSKNILPHGVFFHGDEFHKKSSTQQIQVFSRGKTSPLLGPLSFPLIQFLLKG